jgi:hypothetical protein
VPGPPTSVIDSGTEDVGRVGVGGFVEWLSGGIAPSAPTARRAYFTKQPLRASERLRGELTTEPFAF